MKKLQNQEDLTYGRTHQVPCAEVESWISAGYMLAKGETMPTDAELKAEGVTKKASKKVAKDRAAKRAVTHAEEHKNAKAANK